MACFKHLVKTFEQIFYLFDALDLYRLEVEQPVLLIFYFVKPLSQIVEPALGKPTH